MSSHAHDIKKEVRVYLVVFAALAFLTIVTVGAKYLHLSLKYAIILALCIATLKASLVAAYFMHLVSERVLIFAILIVTALFFIGMVYGILQGYHDVQNGIQFVS